MRCSVGRRPSYSPVRDMKQLKIWSELDKLDHEIFSIADRYINLMHAGVVGRFKCGAVLFLLICVELIVRRDVTRLRRTGDAGLHASGR